MFINERKEPAELTALKLLKPRMNLPQNYYQQYLRLQKGFEGEQAFDKMIQKTPGNFIVARNLLFEWNHTHFQLDSVLFFHNRIGITDVKNLRGDYFIKGDGWYTSPDEEEISNPLSQLNRSQILFKHLLKSLGFASPIDSRLVFVNPQFHLYNAQRNHPIIFPAQIDRFLNGLTMETNKITSKQNKLAYQLLDILADERKFMQLPDFTYEQLTKGIKCLHCDTFFNKNDGVKLICSRCGSYEALKSAVLRSVNELITLFPEKKITTNAVSEWCQIIESQKTIQRILSKHLIRVGSGRSAYYLLDND